MLQFLGRLLSRLILAIVFALMPSVAGAMTFTVHDPCGGGNASVCAMRILGQGPIQAGDAQILRMEVAKWRKEYGGFSGITLHSQGGSLMAGMELGREIRRQLLNVYATLNFTETSRTGRTRVLIAKVQCFSACVYAVLGGLTRDVESGAVIGVHQFSSLAPAAEAESNAQALIVLLRAYVQEMGVSPELLDVASLVRPNQIQVLTASQIAAFGIDNTKARVERWSIRAMKNGQPMLTSKTLLSDGRWVTVGFATSSNGLVAVTSVLLPRGSVALDRIESFPVKEHPALTIDLGVSGRWEGGRLQAWTRRDMAEGFVFEAVSLFDQRFLNGLLAASVFNVADGNVPNSIRDIGLAGAEMSTDGLAEGMRLLLRTK